MLQRLHRHAGSWSAALSALLGLSGCDVPGVILIDPEAGGDQGSGLTVSVNLEDSVLADQLGWSGGVPQAEVYIHRMADPFRPDTLYTDSGGRVRVRDLLPGPYLIAAFRFLSGAETSSTGGVVHAFDDGRKHYLPADTVQLALGSHKAGSIVFSEYYDGGGMLDISGYVFAQFFELYNNSDTTVYLDGMLWGRAVGRSGSSRTCDDMRPWREDPMGLWSIEFHQFPGAGTDHPVAPGQVVVVAVDAVDHSQVHPTLPDLSDADFELEGSADVDNPDVPNLPSVGPISDRRGHGMVTTESTVQFLALRVDLTSLVTAVSPDGYRRARVPAARIVDVFHADWMDPESAPPSELVPREYCNWVTREFDRLEAAFHRPAGDNRFALHRRILQLGQAATPILQDVGTSFVDFVLGVHTPGQIRY